MGKGEGKVGRPRQRLAMGSAYPGEGRTCRLWREHWLSMGLADTDQSTKRTCLARMQVELKHVINTGLFDFEEAAQVGVQGPAAGKKEGVGAAHLDWRATWQDAIAHGLLSMAVLHIHVSMRCCFRLPPCSRLGG